MADDQNPTKAREKTEAPEKRETPGQQPPSIDDLRRKAEKMESEPNLDAAQAISQLEGTQLNVKQLEEKYLRGEVTLETLKAHKDGIVAFDQAMGRVLIKLAKADVDIARFDPSKDPLLNPADLAKKIQSAVTMSGIKLEVPEAAAVDRLDEIIAVNGPTARDIWENWPARIDVAKKASRGFTRAAADWYVGRLEKNPIATVALTIAGVSAAYFTFEATVTYVKRKFAGKEAGEKEGTSWWEKKIMVPLLIALLCGAAGGLLSTEDARKILEKYGLASKETADRVRNGDPPTPDEQSRMQQAADELRETVEDRRRKADEEESEDTETTGPGSGESREPAPERVESDETSPEKLEEFGDNYLMRARAKKVKGDIYELMTETTATYFRFHSGQWEWGSTTENNDEKWVPCGSDHWPDKQKFAWVNSVSDRLAEGPRATEAEEQRKSFGIKFLQDKKATEVADDEGVYMYTTKYEGGETQTYFRFYDGEWEWASVDQRTNNNWVLCGDSYYGNKERYKEVNDIARKLWLGPKSAEEEVAETVEDVTDIAKESAPFDAPLELLVETFCYDVYEYESADRAEITYVIRELREKQVGEILKFWELHKDEDSIPKDNALISLKEDVNEKNVYTAVKILGMTISEYKKRLHEQNIDDLTLQEFFEKHIYEDSVSHVNVAVQQAISSAFVKEGITSLSGLSKLGDLDFSDMEARLKELGENHIAHMCEQLDISLEGVDRKQLSAIIAWLNTQRILISFSTETAFERLPNPEKYDEATLTAAKKFFAAIKERTVKEIVPAAAERFNIPRPRNSDNKDIIKDHFVPDKISFSKAIHLNLVTESIDLKKSPEEGSTPQQELAFLFTVLSTLSAEKKRNYVSELMVLIAMSPSDIKLPSLAFMQPVLSKAVDFGFRHAKNELKGFAALVSALMPNRTAEEEAKFLEDIRHSDWVDFPGSWALEATGGSIQIARDLLAPLINSGKLTIDQLGECESAWDYIQLFLEAGCSFIYSKDEQGRPTGVINFLGKYYVFKPIGILKETFDAALDGEYGGAFKVYTVGTSPFVTLGASIGFVRARRAGQGWLLDKRLWGAFKGAGKGFLWPFHAVKKSSEVAGKAVLKAHDVIKYRGINNLLTSSRKFRAYKKICGLTPLNWREKLYYLFTDPASLVKRLGGKFNEVIALRHMDLTARQLNRFYRFKPADRGYLKGIEGEASTIDAVEDAAERFERFMINASESDDALAKMIRMAKEGEGLSGDKLSRAMLLELRKIEGLSPDEFEALAKQLKEPKDVEKLVGRIRAELANAKAAPEIVAPAASAAPDKAPKAPGEAGAKAGEPEPAKASGVAAEAAEKAEDIGGGKYRYKGEEYRITGKDIKKMQKQIGEERASSSGRGGRRARKGTIQISKSEAVQAICENRYNTPRFIKKAEDGTRLYRFRGRDISLTADEVANQSKLLASAEEKYRTLVAAEEAAGDAVKVSEAAAEGASRGRLRQMGQHFMGETVDAMGGPEKALKTTGQKLDEVTEVMAKARKTLSDYAEARKAGEPIKDVAKAEQEIAEATRILERASEAQSRLTATAEALRKAKNAQEALQKARKAKQAASTITDLQKEFRAATAAADDALELSAKAVEGMSRWGKGLRVLKGVGRGAGALAAAGGAVFSGYETISCGWEAITTDVKGRGTIKGVEAGMWGINFAADTAAVAVLFGAAETGAVGALSSAALPLAPITYAGATVAETLYEETKTDYEWAQTSASNPYAALHNFYTSINSISLGDAWIGTAQGMARNPAVAAEALGPVSTGVLPGAAIAGTGALETESGRKTMQETYDERVANKRETMYKIYRGMVAIQRNPAILKFVAEHQNPTKEDNDALEKMIEENYTINHEFYFQNMFDGKYISHTQLSSYREAQKFILDADMFDRIMRTRDRVKEKNGHLRLVGKNPAIDTYDLEDARFDILGDKKHPKGRSSYNPAHLVEAYKAQVIREFVNGNDVLKGNLERMDTAYLIRLYVQSALALEEKEGDIKAELDAEPDLGQKLTVYMSQLADYIRAARGVDILSASGEHEFYHKPRMTVKEILEHLGSMKTLENKSYREFEEKNYEMTPALQALYEYAQHFSYKGPPREAELKAFFTEDRSGYFGIYWNGEQWYLNERGYEFDDPLGPKLTSAMIEKVIKMMRENPDDILEHRHDTIFWDARDYEYEVAGFEGKGGLAGILEAGLAEGHRRNYRRSDAETRLEHDEAYVAPPPPKTFNPRKIDYSQKTAELVKDYKKVLEYTIGQTAWNNLKYEIKDDGDHIKLTRSDGDAEMWLTRHGDTWQIGSGGPESTKGLSLVQAIAMGNLINWARLWMKKEKLSPGSDSPFEVDGDIIDFDKSGSPFDITFIAHWNQFYEEIGISKQKSCDILNAFI